MVSHERMSGDHGARSRLFGNASMLVVQSVTNAIVLFTLYRYLLSSIGASSLGVYSLVLAAASTMRLGDLGIGASATRFVAKFMAKGEPEEASNFVETACITTAASLCIILAGAYYPLHYGLSVIVSQDRISDAQMLLPYALISLWLGALGGILVASLDGCQRMVARAVILMGANIIYLVGSLLLVRFRGLRGLAYAQIGQQLIILIVGWIVLKRVLPSLSSFPRKWKARFLREMFGYGLTAQASSALAMLFDPATKALMAKLGNLELAGYYEMANRLILQVRGLVVAAVQAMAPVFTTVAERTPNAMTTTYRKAYETTTYLAVPMFAGIAGLAPLISVLWIGRLVPDFVLFCGLLSIGWLANTLAAPAWYANLGTGRPGSNLLGQAILAILNVALGLGLGRLLGALGVTLGWATALAFGSLAILLAFHRHQNISISVAAPVATASLITLDYFGAAVCSISLSGWISLFGKFSGQVGSVLLIACICAGAFIHPGGRHVLEMGRKLRRPDKPTIFPNESPLA